MKKFVTLIFILLLAICVSAQEGGGIFKRGAIFSKEQKKETSGVRAPGLPGHNEPGDQDAPISGIAFPLVFAAGYLALKNRNNKE